MALVTSRSSLNQGSSLAVAACEFLAGTGADIRIDTGAANNLPALAVNEFFEMRDHSDSQNNGLYEVVTVNTTLDDYEVDKVNGAAPIIAAAEAVTTLGATGASTEKSVWVDTAGSFVGVMEQGNVDSDGVVGEALYSFIMQEYKDDDFLLANAPFPMSAISKAAGEFIIGQDFNGNNNGFNWLDSTVTATAIRTRKLLRNTGWNEVSSTGEVQDRFFCCLSVDSVEDPTNDNPFVQFGTDTLEDDTVNATFNGPINEAFKFRDFLADDQINGGSGVTISADGRTLTRSDGGNWRTDGFVVGGQIDLRDSEDSTFDGTWRLTVVGNGVDGVITGGIAAQATATEGFDFNDNGGSEDVLDRNDGGSFIDDGWVIGSKIIVTAAEDAGNDGTHVVLSLTATTMNVVTGSFDVADTQDDNTAVIGMFDDALTPDITINASVNNDNAFRLGMRVRDGDPNGKTYAESDLVTINKAALGNFVFQFPMQTSTDANISETDANIDANTPYTGMSIDFFSVGQSKSGLVGGPFNFGIVMDGNNGTNIECFEWLQRQLRLLVDIDDGAGVAIGRTLRVMARFNGDVLEMGSGNGGLNFPINPQGGGAGIFIDSLNAASDNKTQFYDNTGTLRSKPESIAVTHDINQVAIDDGVFELSAYFDRTIRTNVTDFVITAGSPATFTSAGSALPDNATLDAGDYIRVSGLTGADAAMNGSWQISTETTPGDAWDVVRQDGITAVSVASTTADLDQHAVDTPDALIVHTNINTAVSSDVSFTAPDTITSAGSLFGIFAIGDFIEIEASTAGVNDSIVEVLTVSATTITTVEQDITSQGTGPTVVLTKLFSYKDMTVDETDNFAFDDNVQGGRVVSTTVFIKSKGLGRLGAQYIESPVQDIISGTPETVPMFAATERNVT